MEHVTMPVTRGVTRGVTWPVGVNPDDAANDWDFDLHFTDKGAGEVNIVPLVGAVAGAFARATTAMTMLGTGFLGQVAAGVPRSWYDPSSFRTNAVLQSQGFETASWAKQLNGTGSAPIVTADAGAAPDGSITADRIQFALNGGTTINDRSIISPVGYAVAEPGNGVDGVTRTFSVWMRSNDGNEYLIQTRMNGLSQLNVVTPQWQRFSTTSSAINGDGTVWFGLRGALGTSDSADIMVWGAQVERGASATEYIPTTSTIRSTSTIPCQGYIEEGTRTNLCLQSEDFSTTWANFRSTETLNAVVAPDGTLTADKLVEDATAANTHGIQQLNINIVNAVHTVSVFVKAGERRWCYIDINDGVNFPGANFNLQDGTVGTTFNSVASIQSFPNGWYRCVVTSTMALTATAVGSVDIFLSTGDGGTAYNGDGVSGAYFWGAQLEAAAFASSYIPTTTAAVTRNTDVLTYPTTGWLNASAGTLFSQQQVVGISGQQRSVELDDGTANERILQQISAGGAQYVVTDGGVLQASLTPAFTAIVNTTYKQSFGYAANDFAACVNGGTVSTDTSGTLPTVDTMRIANDAASGNQLFGPIRRVAYSRKRKINGVLQSLTR